MTDRPLLPGSGRLPVGNLRLSDVAALARSLSDTVTERAEKESARSGRAVSCRKGCAACCRQIIPVSEAEAFALRELHRARPPEVRAAFEDRLQSHRMRLEGLPGGASLAHDPDAYFAQRLDCPYLEEEACSIHAQRPLACREHLAISAPDSCSAFPSHAIRILPLSPPVADALISTCARLLGRAPVRIPLTSALAWAEAHVEDGARTWPAAEVVEALTSTLGAPIAGHLGVSVGPADAPQGPGDGSSPGAVDASIL